jgi:PAS domain S-box-containing protein
MSSLTRVPFTEILLRPFQAMRIVRFASFFLLGMGLLSLCAWCFHWRTVVQVLPNTAFLSADTAVCLTLAGVAFATAARQSFYWQRLLGVLLMVLGGLYLGASASYIWFSLHRLFPSLTAAVVSPAPIHTIRMAGSTALAIFLLGSILLLTASPKPSRRSITLSALLATVAASIGVLGLMASLAGISSGSAGIDHLLKMAVTTETAICIGSIGGGALAWAKSGRSYDQFPTTVASFALIGLFLLFGFVDFAIFKNARAATEAKVEVESTSRQIALILRIVESVRKAETGQRGFLLTGDDSFLEAYTRRTRETVRASDTLRDSEPAVEVDALLTPTSEKLAELAETIRLDRANRRQDALAIVTSKQGLFLMNRIEDSAAALVARRQSGMASRLQANGQGLERMRRTVTAASSIAALLTGLGFLLLRTEIRRRSQLEGDLRANAAALEDRVADRTSQIGKQAEALQLEMDRRTRVEKAIRETERRLHIGLDFARVAVWTWEPLHETLSWSGPVERIFGVSAGRLRSYADFLKILLPADREMFKGKVAECVIDGRDFSAEFRVVQRDGGTRWIALRGGATIGKDGEVIQMSGVSFDISERRLAEEQLAISERHFRELAESMPQIVWTANAAGDFEYCNRRWYSLSGVPNGKNSQDAWQQVLHPEDLPSWLNARSAAQPFAMDFRLWDAACQRHRWYLGRAEPILEANGAVIRWFGTFTDIDESKGEELKLVESERRLRQREEQLSLLFNTGAVGDWSWDIVKDELTAHPSVWALYGSPGKEGAEPAAWFTARQHPGDAESIRRAMQTALEETGFLDVEFRVVWPDGSVRWLTCRGVVVRDQTGEPIQVRGLNIDISERKTHELQIQDSERRLREQTDAIPQIVWRTSPDGRIDYCNERWREFSGYSIEETIALGWHSIIHTDDLPRCAEEGACGFSGGAPFRLEFRTKRAADGCYRWLLAQCVPFRNHEGTILHWFGAAIDIDDQKNLSERLEGQVLSRTAELRHSLQLLESREDDLRRSLREKETLLKEVHHRVKNNLQIISSLLRIQEQSLEDSEASAALKDSQHRVYSMALIHERLYGGQQMDEIDFGEYTRALVNAVFSSYSERAVQIVSRFNTAPVRLNIDQAIPCGLILNELITNAIKYAYPSGQNGEILVELSETEGGRVSLTVSDQGVGLPESFDWNALKSMGLPITDMLAKQIGGALSVRSQAGTAFTLEFTRQGKEAKAVSAA